MTEITRLYDIQPIGPINFPILVDNNQVMVMSGETVLSVLTAIGLRTISENDNYQELGFYCAMGICHSCHIQINDRYKRRACLTLVRPDMVVVTKVNRIKKEGLK